MSTDLHQRALALAERRLLRQPSPTRSGGGSGGGGGEREEGGASPLGSVAAALHVPTDKVGQSEPTDRTGLSGLAI